MIAIKGVLIPALPARLARDESASRGRSPTFGFSTSLLLGAAATAPRFFAERLPLATNIKGCCSSRLRWPPSHRLHRSDDASEGDHAGGRISGVENGVFLTALLLHDALPSLVGSVCCRSSRGDLRDLIVINHVQRDFFEGAMSRVHRLQEQRGGDVVRRVVWL